MAEFIIAYQKTEVFEGNYSNDPNDQGGETYKGISRKFHPDWSGWSILDLMNDKNTKNSQLQSLVNSFYHNEFWKFLKCEKFEQTIADELFDTAVNQGKITAAKYLQESLNLLNNNQRHYKDIKVDGVIGNITIEAYEKYMNTSVFPGRSKEKNINTLLKALNGLQFERYRNIVKRSPNQEIYFYGWLQRIGENGKDIKISKGKNPDTPEREQAGYMDSTLAGREGVENIFSWFVGPSTNKLKLFNKTEREVNEGLKYKLKIKISIDKIKKFLKGEKK
jgi:lysozyme family protein